MVNLKSITILTTEYNQFVLITKEIEDVVKESGVKKGIVNVISKHTDYSGAL